MKIMKCNQCGKELEAQTYWYREVLQVLWYCEKCKCGYVHDVYLTGDNAPSPFADASPRDDEEVEEVPPVAFVAGWGEGRGYGDTPKEGL